MGRLHQRLGIGIRWGGKGGWSRIVGGGVGGVRGAAEVDQVAKEVLGGWADVVASPGRRRCSGPGRESSR